MKKWNDWRSIVAWTLMAGMIVIAGLSFRTSSIRTGSSVVVTHQETPTVLMPASAWGWRLYSADRIEAYLKYRKSPMAGKGVGAAVIKACWTYRYWHKLPGAKTGAYMILRPDVVIGIMFHESGGGYHFGLPPVNNPFSWNIPMNWYQLPESAYSYKSLAACVNDVIGGATGLKTYLQDGGSHAHGPSLEGMAVKYVGGSKRTEARNDANWVAGVNACISDFQRYAMSYEQRALVAALSTETLGSTTQSTAVYLDHPAITRRQLAVDLYRRSGGK